MFIELSEMGSAIIAYSTLVKAKELFPGAELFFLVFRKNRESVDVLNVIPPENVIVIGEKNFFQFAVETVKALWKMRRLGIDTCIDMELFSRCTALLSYLSGAKNRVGYDQYTGEGLYRGTFLTRRVMYNSHQHMVLNFLALLYALVAEPSETPLLKRNLEAEVRVLPNFRGTPEEEKRIDEVLAGFNPPADAQLVIVNPDPGLLPLRGWPLENFAAICKKLCEHSPRIIVVAVGLKSSRPAAEFVLRGLPVGQAIDLTGATKTLRELMVLLCRSRLLLTNDSGPAHFAALTPIPSIVLFGPETPLLYSPLSASCRSVSAELSCSPCFAATNHRRSSCTNNVCMQAISVQRVWALAQESLGAL
ncbi:MAG: glycosyltransferase family 9 protein [Deltaproteobacteria bacterium]|nr:glycosyltransferase family 9 protein [Deltaproteobacteria bacterium]